MQQLIGNLLNNYEETAAIILFAVVFTITLINLSISKKNVHY